MPPSLPSTLWGWVFGDENGRILKNCVPFVTPAQDMGEERKRRVERFANILVV